MNKKTALFETAPIPRTFPLDVLPQTGYDKVYEN
jgi:hypothetical protein